MNGRFPGNAWLTADWEVTENWAIFPLGHQTTVTRCG